MIPLSSTRPKPSRASKSLSQSSTPTWRSIFQDPDATIAAYKAGLVASQICPAWYPLGLLGNLPEQSGLWRVMRLPALKEGGERYAFHVPTVTGIPSMAANPDAAWGILYEAQLTKAAQLKFNQVTNGILVTQLDALAELDDKPIEYFGGQKIYHFWAEVLKDIPDVYFGSGWVEARAILTSGIEPIMRGEVSVADGLKTAARLDSQPARQELVLGLRSVTQLASLAHCHRSRLIVPSPQRGEGIEG